MRTFIFVLFFISFCCLSLYRHKNVEADSFRTEIWADRAGYYVYLPSLFLYDFSIEKFPKNIEAKTGNGFYLNTKRDKIETKYTYGVALLQLPFFLMADGITVLYGNTQRNGFSYFYQKAINFAAAFYLTLGLYLLFLSLKIYFKYSNKVIFITLGILFFGTNLYYYGIIETGMSHIYSFFLFSGMLYLVTHKLKFRNNLYFFTLLGITSGLIVLIRPTNIIFIFLPFIWDVNSVNQIIQRIKKLLNPSILLILFLSWLAVFIPQFIYWEYSSGKILSYSYGNESFSNALSPKIPEVLFSPNNGLFPYSLVFIFIFIGIAIFWKSNKSLSLYSSFVFLLIVYITASWHDWRFGCGAGMRNMVEYYSLFSFPLAVTVNKFLTLNKPVIKLSIFALIGFLVLVSFKVNYHFFGCYFSGMWDWSDYFNYLLYPFKYQ